VGPDKSLAIITPLFNDWDSLLQLLTNLDKVTESLPCNVSVFIVDDGTTDPLPQVALAQQQYKSLHAIQLLHLVCNLGHQRAISIGIAEVHRLQKFDAAIIMDSDGEDRVEDIPRFIAAHDEHLEQIIVAQRAQRSEGNLFLLFYKTYKVIFYLLTGKVIDFGNFILIPASHITRIAFNAGIWNNLAATVVRSRIPVYKLPTSRGHRYAGQSKMNLTSLILHGLSAVSVYSDVAFTRVLLGTSILAGLAFLGIIIVFTVRYTTDLAIPGWATNTTGILVILLSQAVMFSAGAIFLILANRSGTLIIPALDGERYVHSRREIQAASPINEASN
jgi:polyisoprenyl-phosphate glycosyltransferase